MYIFKKKIDHIFIKFTQLFTVTQFWTETTFTISLEDWDTFFFFLQEKFTSQSYPPKNHMSRRQMKVPITPVFKPLMGIFWDNNKKSYRTETHNCRIIISGAATGSKIAFILKFSLTVAFHLWGLTAILSHYPHDSCIHTEYWELRGEKKQTKNRKAFIEPTLFSPSGATRLHSVSLRTGSYISKQLFSQHKVG